MIGVGSRYRDWQNRFCGGAHSADLSPSADTTAKVAGVLAELSTVIHPKESARIRSAGWMFRAREQLAVSRIGDAEQRAFGNGSRNGIAEAAVQPVECPRVVFLIDAKAGFVATLVRRDEERDARTGTILIHQLRGWLARGGQQTSSYQIEPFAREIGRDQGGANPCSKAS